MSLLSLLGLDTATDAIKSAIGSSTIQGAFNLFGQGMQNMSNRFNYLMDREYNTPKNQIERLKAAGINPAAAAQAVAGNGAGNTNGPAAGTDPASINNPRLAENYIAERGVKAQEMAAEAKANIDNANADYIKKITPNAPQLQLSQILNYDKDSALKEASTLKSDAERKLAEENARNLEKQREVMQSEIDKMASEIALNNKMVDEKDKLIELNNHVIKWYDQKSETEIRQIEADITEHLAMAKKLEEEGKRKEAENIYFYLSGAYPDWDWKSTIAGAGGKAIQMYIDYMTNTTDWCINQLNNLEEQIKNTIEAQPEYVPINKIATSVGVDINNSKIPSVRRGN